MPLFLPCTRTPYKSPDLIHWRPSVSSWSSVKRMTSTSLFVASFRILAKRFLLGKVTLALYMFHVQMMVAFLFPIIVALSTHFWFLLVCLSSLPFRLCSFLVSPAGPGFCSMSLTSLSQLNTLLCRLENLSIALIVRRDRLLPFGLIGGIGPRVWPRPSSTPDLAPPTPDWVLISALLPSCRDQSSSSVLAGLWSTTTHLLPPRRSDLSFIAQLLSWRHQI